MLKINSICFLGESNIVTRIRFYDCLKKKLYYALHIVKNKSQKIYNSAFLFCKTTNKLYQQQNLTTTKIVYRRYSDSLRIIPMLRLSFVISVCCIYLVDVDLLEIKDNTIDLFLNYCSRTVISNSTIVVSSSLRKMVFKNYLK